MKLFKSGNIGIVVDNISYFRIAENKSGIPYVEIFLVGVSCEESIILQGDQAKAFIEYMDLLRSSSKFLTLSALEQ